MLFGPHTLLLGQFAPVVQQVAGQLPPQSGPVSVPFLTVSVHVGAWHWQGGEAHTFPTPHTLLAQSFGPMQPEDGHAPQVPPQSTAVSLPF